MFCFCSILKERHAYDDDEEDYYWDSSVEVQEDSDTGSYDTMETHYTRSSKYSTAPSPYQR